MITVTPVFHVTVVWTHWCNMPTDTWMTSGLNLVLKDCFKFARQRKGKDVLIRRSIRISSVKVNKLVTKSIHSNKWKMLDHLTQSQPKHDVVIFTHKLLIKVIFKNHLGILVQWLKMANSVVLAIGGLWYENLTHGRHSINSEWKKTCNSEVRLRGYFQIGS